VTQSNETRSPAPISASVDKSSFEGTLARLGEIVERLERGELALEDSLGLFEEGIRLARTAQARLDSAEKRVEELLGFDEQGNPVVRKLGSESE
jgi:exodeoxyribonuclease VII small subunit